MSLGTNENPLQGLEEWDDFTRDRYAEPSKDDSKGAAEDAAFRDYEGASSSVKEFYRQNHELQTVVNVREKRDAFLSLERSEMSVWEAFKKLDKIIDVSDPDTELSQTVHAMQTAEAVRAAGQPRWFILTGLIHDLGKVLCLYGEPQWAVVGDTFPVGCSFSDKIVLSEYFANNPDVKVPEYQTPAGIYEEGCGLDQVLMSWGHDEYLYHVTKNYLPLEAQYIIRYHSFYPSHKEGEYGHLMNDQDREYFRWVKAFNPYDLYTKSEEVPDEKELLPYYEELVREFFPEKLRW